MRIFGFALCATVASVLGAGCGAGSGDGTKNAVGGVAIVDLDAVAKRTGRTEKITQSVQQKEASLNEELAQLQASMRERLTQKKQELGDNPTQKQKDELAEFERQLTVQLGRAQQQGRTKLSEHQNAIVQQFREEMKPLLRQIAAEQGLSIVIPKDERLLLTFEPAVDITDQVVQMATTQNAPARTTAAAN
jgi:Skp family chaperone for outer membrane proteins